MGAKIPVQGDDAQQIAQQASADRIGVGFKEGGVEIIAAFLDSVPTLVHDPLA